MTDGAISYGDTRDLPGEEVIALYRANDWSAADKPRELLAALARSSGDEFYQRCGFVRAGHTEPMWIYAGYDH
jgi:hypothetical protein